MSNSIDMHVDRISEPDGLRRLFDQPEVAEVLNSLKLGGSRQYTPSAPLYVLHGTEDEVSLQVSLTSSASERGLLSAARSYLRRRDYGSQITTVQRHAILTKYLQVEDYCRFGIRSLEYVRSNGTGHVGTAALGIPGIVDFLADRLNGKPGVKGCVEKNVTLTGLDVNALGNASIPILSALQNEVETSIGLNDSLYVAAALASVNGTS